MYFYYKLIIAAIDIYCYKMYRKEIKSFVRIFVQNMLNEAGRLWVRLFKRTGYEDYWMLEGGVVNGVRQETTVRPWPSSFWLVTGLRQFASCLPAAISAPHPALFFPLPLFLPNPRLSLSKLGHVWRWWMRSFGGGPRGTPQWLPQRRALDGPSRQPLVPWRRRKLFR